MESSEYKKAIAAELKKLNCSESEIKEWLTNDVVENAIKNSFSPQDVAWAIVQ
ncbi:MAG: hypothetical protein HFE47_01970 [Clostridia bacterium]|nr:hypothetical protein [Clostridia bacterium]